MSRKEKFQWSEGDIVFENDVPQARVEEALQRFEITKRSARDGGKYCVRSKETGRSLGCYSTREEAEKRRAEIERY